MKVCPDNPTDMLYICRVCYMWEDTISRKKFFHAQWMYRAAETIIGESGDPTELFLCDDCGNSPIGAITEKCEVRRFNPHKPVTSCSSVIIRRAIARARLHASLKPFFIS